MAWRTLAPHGPRIALIEGCIEDASPGPFDAAVCLLTLHFLDPAARQETVRQIHRRLRPGAPFVAAHGSFLQLAGKRDRWLGRYEAYAVAAGADPEQAATARAAVSASAGMLDPRDDLAILRAGGFDDVEQFYAAFTWRGWIGHA